MTDKKPEMILRAIGFVRNGIKKSEEQSWEEVVSEIVINSDLTEALDNLNEFSHIIVLFWLHESKNKKTPNKIHPKRNRELPLVGLFATRSPYRPNPIGKATVKLLERRNNILKVKGLDAIDGTPVIDIKPYIPGYDSVDEAKSPQWLKDIQQRPY